MNTFVNNTDGRKRSKYDRNIHKGMRIPVDIYQTNKKFFVTVQPKNACKLEFADHLWIPFIDEPQSFIVVFTVINFPIYNILVTKCKYGIGPNGIITFNEEL